MELQLNELAKRTGLHKDTIRYYVKIGLLKPKRDPGNGYKLFNKKDEIRLHFICKAKYLGFTLKEIEQIMSECDRGQSPCPMVREFLWRHIESNRRLLQEHIQLQQRMEAAWNKWQKMPEDQAKMEGFCEMIESIVSADLAIENVNQTMVHGFLSSHDLSSKQGWKQ
ncbi:MAG: MerR family transcriptional regulator [Gammaproteobacteria bacterium]